MPPPTMQRQINISSHVGPPANAQTQPMQPGMGPQVGGNTQPNLIPMGEWGNRFPAASGSQCPTQTLRPNNSIPMMQSNQMTQQVGFCCLFRLCIKKSYYSFQKTLIFFYLLMFSCLNMKIKI